MGTSETRDYGASGGTVLVGVQWHLHKVATGGFVLANDGSYGIWI